MADDAPNKDSDEQLREQWFGPLINAEPEEVAAALVRGTRGNSEDHLSAPRD